MCATTASTAGVSQNLCDQSKTDGVFSICGKMDNKNDISVDKLGNKNCNNSSSEIVSNGSKSKISKNSIRNGRPHGLENGGGTKSVGTQYSSIKRNRNEKQEKFNDGDIVVISNEFRERALNQQCLIDSKRKILKLLKSRKNIDWRSLDDMRPDSNAINNNQSSENGSLTNVTRNVISKSDSLVASVELVFIPDECLQETPKKVYILKDNVPGLNKTILSKIQCNGNDAEQKEIFFISDDYRRNSLKNKIVIVDDEPKRRNKPLKYLKNTVQQSSVDDVNNKMVSHAFHSYDEEDENLEKKELKNGQPKT